MKAIVFVILGAFVLIACGPSAEETERALLRDIANRQRLEKELDSTKAAITNSQNTLLEQKGQLEAEKVGLSRIEDWQLGRTPSERDRQIIQQTKVIHQLEESIKKWEAHIAVLERNYEMYQGSLDNSLSIERKLENAGVE